MSALYETNYEIDLNIGELDPREYIEIRNPSGSNRKLLVTRTGNTSEAEFAVFTLRRYTELATHGTGEDAPTQVTAYRYDPAAPAPSFEIWSGTPGVALIWPTSDPDYVHDFQLDSSDAGDDDKIQWNQYLGPSDTVAIDPGTSASISFPPGQALFTAKILIREVLVGEELDVQKVRPDALHGTLFGETRVAQSKMLSYVIHTPNSMVSLGGVAARHEDFAVDSAGGGAIEYLPDESAVRLTVTGADGDRITYRQNVYNPYSPGCQQRITFTTKSEEPSENQEIRIWYGDDDDGIGVLRTSAGGFLFVRSSTSGSVTESTYALPSWIDLDKDNLFAEALEWLGAGDVVLFANNRTALRLDQAGTLDAPFMKRPNLPISVEIKNVGASSPGSVTFYCAKVASEGADVFDVSSASATATVSNVPQGGLLLIQIRPKEEIVLGSIAAQDNRAVYVPKRLFISTANGPMRIECYFDGTVTGSPSWATTPDDVGVEQDSAGTFTGGSGRSVGEGAIDAVVGSTTIDLGGEFRFPGGRTLSNGAFSGQPALQVVGFARSGTVNSVKVRVEWDRIG